MPNSAAWDFIYTSAAWQSSSTAGYGAAKASRYPGDTTTAPNFFTRSTARDLLAVAMREVTEETGLQRLELLHPGIFSLECLTVDGHEKRGQYVPSHIHMNVTYLLGARDRELRQKPDENSGVAWFTPREALEASTEPWMVQRVYSKLTQRAAAYMAR